ncbi:DNA-3-methyladenine glycosylase I [Listeria grayi]|uniref:DNA-3-methyladenine glycosylase I n=1 Tax=Listeria grayi DSM 20601 TaxID=525367 RepID=D7UYN5_LISGR|nr:DNA-3-methyladenine glycosylase I [Listeria grayi]EFI83452.1 DNA-3-methyladenine glycosylase I [Listeria grayi DSM 20601]
MTEGTICTWAQNDEVMEAYHNTEWGFPSYDDNYLFELLNLEGAQAGLSWKIILHRRHAYQEAFFGFDIDRCAAMTDEEITEILQNPGIIRNKLKVNGVRKNAKSALRVQAEFGSLANYFWQFTDNKPIVNHRKSDKELPAKDELSEKISKDLRKRGFTFVGPVIIYSYLQAIGIIDDHVTTCPYHTDNRSK